MQNYNLASLKSRGPTSNWRRCLSPKQRSISSIISQPIFFIVFREGVKKTGKKRSGWPLGLTPLEQNRSYLSHFPTWYSKSGHFPIEIPIKNEKWPPTPGFGSIILKIVLWPYFTKTHAMLRGSTDFWKQPILGHPTADFCNTNHLVRCNLIFRT